MFKKITLSCYTFIWFLSLGIDNLPKNTSMK